MIGVSDASGSLKFSPCPYPNVRGDWIAQRVHDLTYPPVEITVHDVSSVVHEVTARADARAFMISAPKTKRIGGHQIVGGLSKIRSGKECQPYYSAEDDRTKACVPEAAASDLSLVSIAWAIEQHHRKHKVPTTNWESPYDFLVYTGLLERYFTEQASAPSFRVTLAGLLLFGKEAALASYFPGLETVLITDAGPARFRKNLVETYRELCGGRTSMLANLCPTVPLDTVQELISNAFVHRSYREHAPVLVTLKADSLQIESPGTFPVGVSADNLIYCTPIYRNFLLSEGARYIGMCDKIGRGIDAIYESVLSHGFGFPSFEGLSDKVIAKLSTVGNREFAEFIRKRSQFLSDLDEIIVLRFLWDRPDAVLSEIAAVVQRGRDRAQRVMDEMLRRMVVEPTDGVSGRWRLTHVVRNDIQNIFRRDQLELGLDLFGTGELT